MTIDNVDHPKHYTFGKYEVIDVIEDFNFDFRLSSALKYIARAGKKNPEKKIEDLEKAIWYIQRTIDNLNPFEFWYTLFRKLHKNKFDVIDIADDWWKCDTSFTMTLVCLKEYSYSFLKKNKNYFLNEAIKYLKGDIFTNE